MSNKWDKRFLSLAKDISRWSLDPSTKVGAVIVDNNKRIISTGYNGLPKDISDDSSILNDREIKYRMILHAEENAILFSKTDVTGFTIYTWPVAPCLKCSCILIQSGIKRIVTTSQTIDRWEQEFQKARSLFNEVGMVIDYVDL